MRIFKSFYIIYLFLFYHETVYKCQLNIMKYEYFYLLVNIILFFKYLIL